MKTLTCYVAVPVSERLPEKSGTYFVEGSPHANSYYFYSITKSWGEHSILTHWLEQQTIEVYDKEVGVNISDREDKIIEILKLCEQTSHRNVGEGCNFEEYILPSEYKLIASKILSSLSNIKTEEQSKPIKP